MSLEQHIRRLEEQLLNPVLSQFESVERLLADDFLEIGASGRIYDKKKVLQELLVKPSAHCSMMDFSMRPLTRDVVLVTYRTMRQEPTQNSPVYSLRSSIWKHIDDRWQMVFHQGTLANGT
ncbi:MAG: nuclear transport factor 2 family protein [Leptospirales bacterium]